MTGKPVGMISKHGKMFFPTVVQTEGGLDYGPTNRDDGCGSMSVLSTKDAGIDFVAF